SVIGGRSLRNCSSRPPRGAAAGDRSSSNGATKPAAHVPLVGVHAATFRSLSSVRDPAQAALAPITNASVVAVGEIVMNSTSGRSSGFAADGATGGSTVGGGTGAGGLRSASSTVVIARASRQSDRI